MGAALPIFRAGFTDRPGNSSIQPLEVGQGGSGVLEEAQGDETVQELLFGILVAGSETGMLHQIQRCTAPCVGFIGEAEYQDDVQAAVLFLQGKTGEARERLQAQMTAASDALGTRPSGPVPVSIPISASSRQHMSSWSGAAMSAIEQPAARSGSTTVWCGPRRMSALSAMKCTPQKTMYSAFPRLAAARASFKESPVKSANLITSSR